MSKTLTVQLSSSFPFFPSLQSYPEEPQVGDGSSNPVSSFPAVGESYASDWNALIRRTVHLLNPQDFAVDFAVDFVEDDRSFAGVFAEDDGSFAGVFVDDDKEMTEGFADDEGETCDLHKPWRVRLW